MAWQCFADDGKEVVDKKDEAEPWLLLFMADWMSITEWIIVCESE